MTDEEYVSYSQASTLKAAGFDYPTNKYYTTEDAPSGQYWVVDCFVAANHNSKSNGICSAPSLAQAAKWLREEKQYEVSAAYCRSRKSWYYWHGALSCIDEEVDCVFSFPSYEAALSAGIDKALEIINKKI